MSFDCFFYAHIVLKYSLFSSRLDMMLLISS